MLSLDIYISLLNKYIDRSVYWFWQKQYTSCVFIYPTHVYNEQILNDQCRVKEKINYYQ